MVNAGYMNGNKLNFNDGLIEDEKVFNIFDVLNKLNNLTEKTLKRLSRFDRFNNFVLMRLKNLSIRDYNGDNPAVREFMKMLSAILEGVKSAIPKINITITKIFLLSSMKLHNKLSQLAFDSINQAYNKSVINLHNKELFLSMLNKIINSFSEHTEKHKNKLMNMMENFNAATFTNIILSDRIQKNSEEQLNVFQYVNEDLQQTKNELEKEKRKIDNLNHIKEQMKNSFNDFSNKNNKTKKINYNDKEDLFKAVDDLIAEEMSMLKR